MAELNATVQLMLNACRVKVPEGKPVQSLGVRAGKWYAREMPMSFMVAMENLTDISHVSFAHHGITPSAPSPLPFDISS
jgi:phenylpropionate dioxygenase-like ring-hydroxylating dioxygenase large terminal subunit